MKDLSNKEVENNYGWGRERQRELATNLCHDCRGILERIQDLENGAKKRPIRNYDPRVILEMASLDADNPVSGQKFEELPIFNGLAEDNSLPHKSNRADLLVWSELGCIMCAWLLRSLQSRSVESNSTIIEQWLKRPATLERDLFKITLSNRCVGHYRVNLRSPTPKPPHPSVVPFTNDERSPMHINDKGGLVRLSAPKLKPFNHLRGDELGSLVVDIIPSSNAESQQLLSAMAELEPETPSSSTWKLFKTWLRVCDSGHSECKQHATRNLAQLPGRLIDVQSVDIVRVVETSTLLTEEHNALQIVYATISHCWGETHEPQLNKHTSDQLRKGIATKDLPRLFQDVVILVQRLDIPYLWIDSLCIQQDSVDNCHQEISKMGSVYLNAYLCVAASASENNLSGILQRHKKDWPQPLIYENLVIQADFSMVDTKIDMQQPLWCDRMRTLFELAVNRAPLNQRAWVLQERIFSRRILHCTSDEFVWECCRGMTSESHPLVTVGGSITEDAWKQLCDTPQLLQEPSMPERLHLIPKLQCLERWSELIHTFSSHALSFPNDRLPACSAIAKRLQPMLGEYVAGLWERYMPTQLLWKHQSFCQVRVGEGEAHILRSNNSPSWSWSSVDCQTILPYYYDNMKGNFTSAQSRNFDRLVGLYTRAHIKILNIHVNLSGEDVTGAVEGGQINLVGRLFPIYKSVPFGYWLTTEAPSIQDNFWDRTGYFTLDHPEKHGIGEDKAMQREALQPVSEEEQNIMMQGSYDNIRLRHKKLSSVHSPALTKLCFLPVTEKPYRHYSRGEGGVQLMETCFILCGLVLQHEEEKGEGVYRRVGYFEYALDEFKKEVKCKVDGARPLTDRWPSRKNYSPEGGFNISII